jgi:hypothetical protein
MVQFKWLVVLGLFLIALQPSYADDRAQLVGVWKLVSWEWEVQATGARLPSMGKNPTGYRVFTPEGRMMQIVTAEGRKAPNTEKERAKIIPGAFTTVRFTVALPKGRSSAAQAKLAEIVNEAKKTGVVRKAIEQVGMKGVRVAPD